MSLVLEKGLEDIKSGISAVNVRFDGMDKRLTGSDARLEALEKKFLDILSAKYGKNEPVPEKQWSWARFCVAAATKDWSIAPYEREECLKYRERVDKAQMTATSFSGGGAFIPEQYVQELIGLLRPALISQQLGVRLMTGLRGSPISMPKILTGASYYWIAPEGTSITKSGLTTGRFQMTPHKIAALVTLSNDLLMLNSPSAEAAVRADITASLAEGIDKAFWEGTGSSGQPIGVANKSPAVVAGTTAWGTDNITKLNSLKDVVKLLASNNALSGNLAWAMNVNSWFAIDKLVDLQARPYLQPDPSDATRFRLLGYPAYMGTPVSASGTDLVWFGNWSDAIIGVWSEISVASSTETSDAFEKDELWIRAIAHVDVGFRRDASFGKVNGAVA